MRSDPSTGRPGARLACFDLGGVLVRIAMTWNEACHFAGIDVRVSPAGEAGEALRREFASRLERGHISLDQWADGVSRALEGTYTPDELKHVHHAITRAEHPGALALVDELHDAGIATACLSNTNHEHWVRLVHHDGVGSLEGPPEYPAVQRLKQHFASHILRLAKPDAAIYQEFERRTGTQGSAILFFDDREGNVVAARRRGWLAERIDAGIDPIPQIRKRLREEGWI